MRLRSDFLQKSGRSKLALAAPPLVFLIIAAFAITPRSLTSGYFTDVYEYQPFFNTVNRMYELGITLGYGDGTYRLGDSASRGMAAVFFVRAWSLKTYGSADGFPDAPAGQYNGSSFADVPTTHAFFRWIQKMHQIGLTEGWGYNEYGQLIFCPDYAVSNLSAAVFAVRASQIASGHPDYLGYINEGFSYSTKAYFVADMPPNSDRYNYVQRVRDRGVVGTGCAERAFCPYNAISRGDLSYYVIRGPINEFAVTRQTSNSPANKFVWEPSLARGGTTWSGTSYVAAYNLLEAQQQGQTTPPPQLLISAWNAYYKVWNTLLVQTPPGATGAADPYVIWDKFRNRFVMVALYPEEPQAGVFVGHVYIGYSTDATGYNWTWRSSRVFEGNATQGVSWDYPSVALDSTGRIVVGAVKFQMGLGGGPRGYYTVMSTDGGVTFGPQSQAVPESWFGSGHQSRLIGGNGRFHLFTPTLYLDRYPTGVFRFESVDGVNWGQTYQTLWTTAYPPVDSSTSLGLNACDPGTTDQNCRPVWYASLPDAYGDPESGRWSVVGLTNDNQRANVFICTSDRGCGIVNRAPNDQFSATTTISDNGTYWVSYYTYTNQAPAGSTAPSSLMMQSIALHPGQAAVGTTVAQGIAPASWAPVGNRCQGTCYAAGDYAKMVPTYDFLQTVTPTLSQAYAKNNELFTMFLRNPAGSAFYAPFATEREAPNPEVTEVKPQSGNDAAVVTRFDPPATKPIFGGVTSFQPNFVDFPRGTNMAQFSRAVPHPNAGTALDAYLYKLRLFSGKVSVQP